MGDEQNQPRARRPSGPLRAIATLREHAKSVVTVLSVVATSTALVWGAGRDYQSMKSQIEADHAEIQVLRAEVQLLESTLLEQPRRVTP